MKIFNIMISKLFQVFLIFVLFFSVDILGKIYISQMSQETQYKIEKIYKQTVSDSLNIDDSKEENKNYLKNLVF